MRRPQLVFITMMTAPDACDTNALLRSVFSINYSTRIRNNRPKRNNYQIENTTRLSKREHERAIERSCSIALDTVHFNRDHLFLSIYRTNLTHPAAVDIGNLQFMLLYLLNHFLLSPSAL